MSEVRAVCDRAGVIDIIGLFAPLKGRLPFARGEEAVLRLTIEPLARHSYDGKTLIVSGVRDADDPDDALDALLAFQSRVGRGLRELKSHEREQLT